MSEELDAALHELQEATRNRERALQRRNKAVKDEHAKGTPVAELTKRCGFTTRQSIYNILNWTWKQ